MHALDAPRRAMHLARDVSEDAIRARHLGTTSPSGGNEAPNERDWSWKSSGTCTRLGTEGREEGLVLVKPLSEFSFHGVKRFAAREQVGRRGGVCRSHEGAPTRVERKIRSGKLSSELTSDCVVLAHESS